ncbi:coiled-coil and C2 domain-containing protein 1-like isoform X2 [Euwallacea fornicatus]|uniref:coiled-coil and C2 domain-containing protein 1-like isoform X2 n=1 Tax=Euwallacea fornicatus TaxID=995702 RepID=UPI003390659F
MFGRKKPDRPRSKPDHSGNLAQFGLMDIPQDFNAMGQFDNSEGSDDDLEAELAALAGDGTRQKSSPKKTLKQPLLQHELNAIVQGTLKDVDENVEDEDVDENDPDLLSELQEITGEEEQELKSEASLVTPPSPSMEVVNILEQRISNYKTLESEAKNAEETSKARRYGRAIKTLNDLLKTARAGGFVNLNDESTPPEIKIKPKPSTSEDISSVPSPLTPSRPAPAMPETNHMPLPDVVQSNVAEAKKEIDQELLNMLLGRQKEYKIAMLQAKKSGDTENALGYMKIWKVFDHVIQAVRDGQEVDLSDMPGPPGEAGALIKVQENEKQGQADDSSDIPEPQLVTANTVEEALLQRLELYKTYEQKAKEENNNSKARRFGRIVKQYEQALKAHKAGRPLALDELPTPPGFGPIPVPELASQKPATPPEPSSERKQEDKPSPSNRISGNKVLTSHQEKQVLILQAKQKQFKLAAVTAKKQGELMQAKEFLKQTIGFNKLIEAAQAGLPVDWATIPVSPDAKSQLDNVYDIVMVDECTENDDSDGDLLTRLENQLTKQLKMCLSTRDHHKALGDVAGTNRFEQLALSVTKDLDIVRVAKRRGGRAPTHHYETKEFSIVKSFTELTDNEMELVIIRGINYRSDSPKDIDTYVKFEFAFPQETPYSDKTFTVRDTNNPEYNKTFLIPIQRNSRQCQRVFKRHGIKFNVYSKGGFFRSDTLIGSVNLKLQPLETQCEIHDSFELMDGRRKTGGKLEVRLRVRNPIATQQVEQLKEKWLVLDQ